MSKASKPHIRLDDVDDLATRIQGRGWGLDDPKGERQAALDALLALLDEESTAAQANYNRAVVAEAQAKNLEEQQETFEAALQLIADNCEVVTGADGLPVIVYGLVDARAVAAEALARVRDSYPAEGAALSSAGADSPPDSNPASVPEVNT